MTRNVNFFHILLIALFSLSMVGCVSGGDGFDPKSKVFVGDKVPSFTAYTPEGEPFNSAEELNGKVSIILLFTVRCPDCTLMLPHFDKLWRATEAGAIENFQLIAINRDEPKKEVGDFWDDEGFSMKYYLDPQRKIFNLFAGAYVPRVYLVDSEGVVTDMWVQDGLPNYQEMRRMIEELQNLK